MLEKNKVVHTAEEYREIANIHRRQLKAGWLLFLKTGVFTVAAFISLITFTAAWFANNQKVNNDGMNVHVEVSPNLVITNDKSEVSNLVMTDSVTVMVDNANHLSPATHGEVDPLKNEVNLIYNSNPQDVSFAYGYEIDDAVLKFKDVPKYTAGDLTQYYIDYIVYIASKDKAMNVSALNASLSFGDIMPENDETESYFYSSSVDYYVGLNDDEPEYKGTLNLAGKDYQTYEPLTSVNIALLDAEGFMEIPECKNGYVTVLMRFYFDGDLEDNPNAGGNRLAYVHSDNLYIRNFSIDVGFDAITND